MGSCTTAPREVSYSTMKPATPIKSNTVQTTSLQLQQQNSLINIRVDVTTDANMNDIFILNSFPYKPSTTINHLLQSAMTIIHTKYYPKVYQIRYINKQSFFVSQTISKQQFQDNKIHSTQITQYTISNICKYGLKLFIVNEFQHKPNELQLVSATTCEYIHVIGQNALKCPIYRSMINYCDFTMDNFTHLLQFNHLRRKPQCQLCQQCPSFLNTQKGGNEMYDKCHMQLYRHPIRNSRQQTICANISKLVSQKCTQQNPAIYAETNEDAIEYKWNQKDGFMSALIVEVIENGFSCDLYVAGTKKISFDWSILSTVDERMRDIRHQQIGAPLNRGEMLALILYTNGECSYDLCASQRNGNYAKWKWFDYCLYHAIKRMSRRESGEYKLYAAAACNMKKKIRGKKGYFCTYMSTCWDKDILLCSLPQNGGVIIEIAEEYRKRDRVYCCDVSWISQFGDECEVLIARSTGEDRLYETDRFTLLEKEELNGIKIISLKAKESNESYSPSGDMLEY